jgi:hypothetical protein
MNMKRYLLSMAFFCSAAYGDTLTYQTIMKNDTTSTVFILSQIENGKKARAEYHDDGVLAFSEVVMTDSFSTRNWRYICCQEKSDISGWLVNNAIVIKGKYKNRDVYKTFPQKNIDWKQMFPFDLRKFVLSDSTETRFCGVSIIGLANLQLGTLEANKIGMEHLTISGKDLELLHIRVSPPGWLSIFWHGDYWYTKNSGTMVKSISFDNPGLPPVISILN